MLQAEQKELSHPPSTAEIFQQLHNLLLYWLSPTEVNSLLAQIAFKELSSPRFLEDITRIVIASNPNGKKTRGLIQALHSYFTRPGGNPLIIEALDPEELSGQMEVSVSSAGLAANWKVDQARRGIAGGFGGDTVVVGTDTIIFAGSNSLNIERFPNPERDRHFALSQGLPWTWESIRGQVDRVVAKIASREDEPHKEAVVIAHCVTSFARKALGEDVGVLFNLGYSIRTIYWGIEERQIWADIERYREENTIGHMNKRPPLVKLAEDYRDHITEVDITHLVCGLLADTVGHPITVDTATGEEVLMDPGEENIRFLRPGILQRGQSIYLLDVLGVLHAAPPDLFKNNAILQAVDDNGRNIFSPPSERNVHFLVSKTEVNIHKILIPGSNGELRPPIAEEVSFFTQLLEQARAYEKVLDIVTTFMIDGIPPQAVLAAFLASVEVPRNGNSHEVTIVGYPELLKRNENDPTQPRETAQERTQRIRRAYVKLFVGKYEF